jgi:hypothetical protein
MVSLRKWRERDEKEDAIASETLESKLDPPRFFRVSNKFVTAICRKGDKLITTTTTTTTSSSSSSSSSVILNACATTNHLKQYLETEALIYSNWQAGYLHAAEFFLRS